MVDFSEADDTGGAPSPQLDVAAAAKRAAVAANAPKAQLSWMDQVGRFFWNPDGELENLLTRLPGAVADLGVRGAGYMAEGLYRTLPGASEETAKKVGAATRELVGGELERRQGVVPEPGAQFGHVMHEEPSVAPRAEAPVTPPKAESAPVSPGMLPKVEAPPAPPPSADPLKPAMQEAGQSMRTMQAGASAEAPASAQLRGAAEHFSPNQAEARAAVEQMNQGITGGATPRQPLRPSGGAPPAGGGRPGGKNFLLDPRKVLSPSTMGRTSPLYGSKHPLAEKIDELRGEYVHGPRMQTEGLAAEHQRTINSLHKGYGDDPRPLGDTRPTQRDFIARAEKSRDTPLNDPRVERAAQFFKERMAKTWKAWVNRPANAEAIARDIYFPGIWKPDEARDTFMSNWSSGKLGSYKHLQEKKYPTIGEALDAGLTPLHEDPTYTLLHYQDTMNRALAAGYAWDWLKDQGYVKWAYKGKAPPGYVAVRRGREPITEPNSGRTAYLPEDVARIWNNQTAPNIAGYFTEGAPREAVASIADTARQAQNTLTMTKLLWPAFHLKTMAKSAIVSQQSLAFDRTIGAMLKGEKPEWLHGFRDLVTSPFAPVTQAFKGRKAIRALYGGQDTADPLTKKVMDALLKGGFQPKPPKMEWGHTAEGNLIEAFRRGSIKREMKTFGRGMAEAGKAATQLSPAALKALPLTVEMTARGVESLTHLFWNKYIPQLKTAAAFDDMRSFIQRNPDATEEEILREARATSMSVDNRFGQMNTDTSHMHAITRQGLQFALLSANWWTSFMREFAGASVDIAKLIATRDPRHLSRRASYMLMYGMSTAIAGYTLTYLRTGKPPQTAKDYLFPPTGGTNADGTQERTIQGGHDKDIVEMWEIARQSPSVQGMARAAGKVISGKFNPFAILSYQSLMGEDWMGRPLNPTDDTSTLIQRLGENVLSNISPIALEQLKGQTKGSKIDPLWGALTGERKAPPYISEPATYDFKQTKREYFEALDNLKGDRKYRATLQNPKEMDTQINNDIADVIKLKKRLGEQGPAAAAEQYQGTVAPQQ